jgi:hypothetical protein
MSLASSRAVIGRFIGVAGGEAKDGAVEEGVGGIYDGSGLVIIDRGSRSGCRKWKKPTAPQKIGGRPNDGARCGNVHHWTMECSTPT